MSNEDRDINEVFEDLLLAEENLEEAGFEEGFEVGVRGGNTQGYHIGYHRGAELGAELGYYLGIVTAHIALQSNVAGRPEHAERVTAQLTKVKRMIESFPKFNSEDIDFLTLADSIRVHYKKACSLLKIDGQNPYAGRLSF